MIVLLVLYVVVSLIAVGIAIWGICSPDSENHLLFL